jgi:7-keto-8-aminopelargonate synthetase-like enzyme
MDFRETQNKRRRPNKVLGEHERKSEYPRHCPHVADPSHVINFIPQDIDSLVEEYEPAPLVDAPGSKTEMAILPALPTIVGPASHKPKIAASGKIALNLASPNWSGFLDNERLKEVAIQTLREYGTSPCGPPGFYGTLGETTHVSAMTGFETELQRT